MAQNWKITQTHKGNDHVTKRRKRCYKSHPLQQSTLKPENSSLLPSGLFRHTSINQPLKFYIYKQTDTPNMMFLDEKKIPFQYHKHWVFTIISQTNQPNLKFTSLPSFWGVLPVLPLFCCRFTQLQGRSWTSAHNAFVLPTNSHPRWVLSLRFDASKQVVPGKSR